MAAPVVNVDAREVAAAVKAVVDLAEHPSPEIMAAAGEDLIDGIQELFATAGNGAWPPLAESTLRRRRGSEAQILVDTGRMRASIASGSDAVRSGPAWVEVGTDVEYAVYHVSAAPRRVIPLRNFFDVSDEVIDRATETILDLILQEAGYS